MKYLETLGGGALICETLAKKKVKYEIKYEIRVPCHSGYKVADFIFRTSTLKMKELHSIEIFANNRKITHLTPRKQ
jgi:hypothetical protein